MNAQVIMKDGRPEWAVLPYAEYEALLNQVEQLKRQMSAAQQSFGTSSNTPGGFGSTPGAGAVSVSTTKGAGTSSQTKPAEPASEKPAPEKPAVIAKPATASQPPAPKASAGASAGVSGEVKTARQWREQKGMDVKMVARDIGISPGYLLQIETGEREPSDPIRRNIARALGVEQEEIRF